MTSVLELRQLICAMETKNMDNILRKIVEDLINHFIIKKYEYRYNVSESFICLSEKYLWYIPDFLKKLLISVSETSLRDINFGKKSIISQIDWSRNKLSNIKISDVCFFNKYLEFNILKNVSFCGCHFIEFSFSEDSFYDVKFFDCKFEKTYIKKVHMIDTKFIGCHFNQTEFNDCNLTNIFMKDCVCSGLHKPEEGYLQYGISFFSSYLLDTLFEGCSFDELNFHQSLLDDCVISKSKITNSPTGTSVFRDTYIGNCNISNVDFSESLFQDCVFFSSDFESSLFHNSHIKETVFKDCKLHYLHFCTIDNESGYKSLLEGVSFLKCMVEEDIIFHADTQLIDCYFCDCNFGASHFSIPSRLTNFDDI